MSFRFNARHLALCLSLTVFFSCKKDDSPAPPPSEPTLFDKVQGRWDAEVEVYGRGSNPSVSPKEQDMPRVSSVEFFSDSTYILVFNHQSVYSGKLSVVDSAAFSFAGFGNISNIQITNDSLSFNCTYYDYPVSVKAGKVDELVVSSDKKPLLKTWVLSQEEDGASLYEEYQVAEGKKITMLFSSAGTFLTQIGDGNNAEVRNWKWHPQIANAAVAYYPWQSEINYNAYYKIAELTNTGLKIQQVYRENDQEVVANTYILTAK